MLSLNKKFEATLTHKIHWISVFTISLQGVHHRKRVNGGTTIYESTIVLRACLWFSVFLQTFSLPVYQKVHVASVCEKVIPVNVYFIFSVPVLTFIHVDPKGNIVILLTRIAHASHGCFNLYINPNKKAQNYYQWEYIVCTTAVVCTKETDSVTAIRKQPQLGTNGQRQHFRNYLLLNSPRKVFMSSRLFSWINLTMQFLTWKIL